MFKNTMKTGVLLASLGGLIVAVAGLLGGGSATSLTIGLAIALVMVGGSYWFSASLALRSARAQVSSLNGRLVIPRWIDMINIRNPSFAFGHLRAMRRKMTHNSTRFAVFSSFRFIRTVSPKARRVILSLPGKYFRFERVRIGRQPRLG